MVPPIPESYDFTAPPSPGLPAKPCFFMAANWTKIGPLAIAGNSLSGTRVVLAWQHRAFSVIAAPHPYLLNGLSVLRYYSFL